MLTVTNNDGRPFHVRLVEKGDRYGRDDCLTHDEARPMIEFYDATCANRDPWGPRGQFVSRYYLSTLREHGAHGIDLDGGVPVWKVSAENMRYILDDLADVQNEGE